MRRSRSLKLSCAVLLALPAVAPPALAQVEASVVEAARFELTVADIMRGPELVGTAPSRMSWSPDGRTLYFVWKGPQEETEGFYQVARNGSEPQRLPDEEAFRIQPRLRAAYSEDRDKAVYQYRGDLYLLDVGSGRAFGCRRTVRPSTTPATTTFTRSM
jgi:hypothetical protein